MEGKKEPEAKSQKSEEKKEAPEKPDGNDPSRPVRLYCDGVFDLFHFGHARLFKYCKSLFKHAVLVVGVTSDEDTIKHKGKQVMTQYERQETVRHCKWVDEVICPCPWIPTVTYLKEHNIDYICHDPEPYKCGDVPDAYGEVKKAGMFLPTQRTEGVSTSDLILRIVKDHEDYMWRSLQKNYTTEDLGITKEYAKHLKKRVEAKKKAEKAKEVKEENKEVVGVGEEIKKLQEELDKLSLAGQEISAK